MKNTKLTNETHFIGPPKSWDPKIHGDCLSISVHAELTDIGPKLTTVWELSDEEREMIANGGRIQLSVYAPQHPVMNIGVLHEGQLSELEP